MRKVLFVIFLLIIFSAGFIFYKNKKVIENKSLVQKEVPTRFIAFGDSGTGDEAQKKLAKVMEQHPFELIVHTGDIAYKSGTADELQKYFFDIYDSILKRATFYPSPGNHDYLTDNLGPYLTRFTKERYYSFDQGPIHFVGLDTNTPIYGDEMTEWLDNDLKNNSKDKWTVIFFHHPPYSSGKVHGDNIIVQKKLVPIFEKYKVNLVLSGHEHNYERMKPLNGVLYIVTGGGSGVLYQMGPVREMTEFRAVQTHFVQVEVTKCKLDGKAINVENEVIDSFVLKKCPDGSGL